MEIDVKEYVKLITRKWWLIAVFVIIGSALTYWVQSTMVRPVYQATVEMIMNHSPVNAQEAPALDYDSVRTNLMLMETYSRILTSSRVLDEAVRRVPEAGLTSEQLENRIQVFVAPESQIMILQVRGSNYEHAALLANAITEAFRETLSAVYQISNVTVLNQADLNSAPAPLNRNTNLYLLIAAIASFLLGIVVVTVQEYMNDTFRRGGDIERYLDVPVMAAVPKLRKKDLEWQQNEGKRAGERNHVHVKQKI